MSDKKYRTHKKREYRNYHGDSGKANRRPDVRYESDSLLTKHVQELGTNYSPDERHLRYDAGAVESFTSSDIPKERTVQVKSSADRFAKEQDADIIKKPAHGKTPNSHTKPGDETAHAIKRSEQTRSFRFVESNTSATEAAAESANTKKAVQEAQVKKLRHRLNHGDESSSMIRGAGSLAHRAVNTVTKPVKHYLRHELDEADQENAAIQSIKTGTDAGRMIHSSKRHENIGDSPYVKATAETKKQDHPAQTERQKKDRIKAFNRKRQNKQTVMKRREGKAEGIGGISNAVKRAFSKSGRTGSNGGSFRSNHKGGIVMLSIGGVFFVIVLALFGGATVLFQGGGTPVVETTYGSSDADIYAAENELCRLEDNLNSQINSFEKKHPGYDEYEYQIDEIEHNPYALTSYLEARYGAFTMNDSIKAEIGQLFKAQYTLTVSEKTEKRTRMETMKGTRSVYDEKTGQWKTQEYTYEQEVEYDYRICYCTLTNKGFESIAAKELNDAQSFKFNLLTTTMGNRTYLFDTSLSGTYGSHGKEYEIPPEALSDVKFANMIREAEKYLGMPYVAGGKSVKTGFDCSGFVCWVLNHCGNGWNVGQKRAKDLCSMCIRISPAQAKPGDLIFFEKTYETTGASHVGIYVGNGMMIHCGNPIKYSSINTRYFKEHFLCFGRLPFNQ